MFQVMIIFSFRGFQLSNIYEIYELCVNKSPNQWRFCRTCHLFYWRWWDSTILTPGNSANCDLFGMVSFTCWWPPIWREIKRQEWNYPGILVLISWTEWGKENPSKTLRFEKFLDNSHLSTRFFLNLHIWSKPLDGLGVDAADLFVHSRCVGLKLLWHRCVCPNYGRKWCLAGFCLTQPMANRLQFFGGYRFRKNNV